MAATNGLTRFGDIAAAGTGTGTTPTPTPTAAYFRIDRPERTDRPELPPHVMAFVGKIRSAFNGRVPQREELVLIGYAARKLTEDQCRDLLYDLLSRDNYRPTVPDVNEAVARLFPAHARRSGHERAVAMTADQMRARAEADLSRRALPSAAANGLSGRDVFRMRLRTMRNHAGEGQ